MAKDRFSRPPSPRLPERGAIVKEWGGRYPVAIGYPNVYPVAMANLGFQAVYTLLNADERVVAERFVLPPAGRPPAPLKTLESGRLLTAARAVIFSVSFESDYLHVVRLLRLAGLEPLAADRRPGDPLVLAGGVATMINPLPLAPFVDAFLLGEGEVQVPPLLARLLALAGAAKEEVLAGLRELPGVMVPALDCPDPGAPPRRPVTVTACRRLDDFVPASTVTPSPGRQLALAADFLLWRPIFSSRSTAAVPTGAIFAPPVSSTAPSATAPWPRCRPGWSRPWPPATAVLALSVRRWAISPA
ncbi:MAG: hypothetical protein JRJ56_05965 [Deltaproteobacteria bacterium]|nr:hypothetical protein [Deltaproteobacteria bacterium]